MGKKSPKVPAPPDPVKTAQAQAEANKEALQESARLNSVNLYGPSGSTTYGFRPDGTPHSQYTQLTPQGQWLYDAQQAIAGQLTTAAYQKASQVPMDSFSLAGMPYDPRGYNTSSYNMFSPISLPRGADVPGTFGQGQTQDPSAFFGGANNWNAVQGALGKSGQGQPMPAPQGSAPANGNTGIVPASAGGSPVPGGTQYQQSPGQIGGQQTPINNQWFPDSSVYATPNQNPNPATGASSMPQFPGTGGASTNPAVAAAAANAAAPAPTPWSYGQAFTPDMMKRKASDLYTRTGYGGWNGDKNATLAPTGYGLDLAKQYSGKGDFSKLLKTDPTLQNLSKNYKIDSADDLLYLQRPHTRLGAGMTAFGVTDPQYAASRRTDANSDDLSVLRYRMDYPTAAAAAQEKRPKNPAIQPQSVMPTFPGTSPQPTAPTTGAATGAAPTQASGSPQASPSQGFDMQAFMGSPAGQALGGKGGGGVPPGGDPNGYYPGQPGGSNMNVMPYDPRSYGNIDSYVNNVQDAVFDQQARNLRPAFDQQYSRQMQDLADRGLPVGGEAWNSAVSNMNRDQSNAWQQAANQAIAAGCEEANRRIGMEQGLRGTAWTEALGTHQQQNSDIQQRLQIEQNLRNQAVQEYLMGRTQSFNEASAILQGSPALQMPSAPQMPTYQMQAPDVIGATMGAYNAQMQAYQAKTIKSA
jgi:hypothetical protein